MEAREYHDAYSESLEADFQELESALLSDTVKILAPNEPIKCSPETTVHAAILQMMEKRRASVVVVDREGELRGIFTERDLLRRVAVPGRDPKTTPLSDVMTRDPESLGPDTLIAYAINRLHNANYRTIPLVDAQGRPIGVMTARRGPRNAYRPRRAGGGMSIARDDRVAGRYFTCSASHFAAFAWASESPCLPAPCVASASFERAFASSIMPALRAFCRSSPMPAFGSAVAIASLALLTRVGQLKAQAEPTVASPTTSASDRETQVRMACLLIRERGRRDRLARGTIECPARFPGPVALV